MRIPHTIPKTVFEAYKCSEETIAPPNEQARTLRAENSTWDKDIVPDLKVLAVHAIAKRWAAYPYLDELPTRTDRDILIEILPIDMPFELTIAKIPDEFYWERCAKHRWPYNDVSKHGNSWRQLYCERYLAEYIQELEPSLFTTIRKDLEKLVALLEKEVYTMEIKFLKPSKKPVLKPPDNDLDGPPELAEDVVNHIPLSIVLTHLPHLTELSMRFGMIYMNDGFEWRDFEFSVEDCKDLGAGLKACRKLVKFHLTRSNLNQPRAAGILQGLALNDSLEELDLSHCCLEDTGAHVIGEFLSLHRCLRSINLTNNRIGASGVAGIVVGIGKKRGEAMLRSLNLRLNIFGDAGFAHILALLMRNDSIETYNLSGCGFTEESAISMAEVLESGQVKGSNLSFDLSNNDLGQVGGEQLAAAMNIATIVVGLDYRMCNFSSATELALMKILRKNRYLVGRDRTSTTRSSLSMVPYSDSRSRDIPIVKITESEEMINLDELDSMLSHLIEINQKAILLLAAEKVQNQSKTNL